MLKYFKRQKSQRSTDNDNDVASNAEKRHSLLSTSSFCDEILEEDTLSLQSCGGVSIDATNIGEDIFNYHSRLSMTLTSILKDTDCLSCFVQYLETQNALALIKFYLDTENFKISALEQMAKKDQIEENLSNSCAESIKETLCNNDVESGCLREESDETVNDVPELKTLCDLSMHKPLTDDEKSKIYAETNKQMTKCSAVTSTAHKLKAYSELSLYSEMSFEGASSDDIHNAHAPIISAASIKDAIAIYQKYLNSEAQLFVELPVNVLSDISLLLCRRQDESIVDKVEELPVSADCFDGAQKFVLSELERLYLNDFLQSPFYCKFCLELISNEEQEKQLTINDVLHSEVTLFFFMEFLEQQGERECLDFWTAAINFRKSYACLNVELADHKEIQEDAMVIYKKFFSLQSEERLWLSDKLRSHVEECICGSPNKIANCFDLALKVTAKYLDKKYFSAFLKSKLFAQYVNELKMKIQDAHGNSDNFDLSKDTVDGDFSKLLVQRKLSFKGPKKHSSTPASGRRHRKTLSDCTNDISRGGVEVLKHISQHNTLLAMDTSSMHLKNLESSGTSMSIDARHLTNPNLLWYRRYSTNETENGSGGLKFGRVNALGRYERDFETIESFNNHGSGKHNWSLSVSGSKIKNAMRKLVNLPEHKAQEEIAWQIAEMIVKDVTNITLKNTPMANGVKEATAVGVNRES